MTTPLSVIPHRRNYQFALVVMLLLLFVLGGQCSVAMAAIAVPTGDAGSDHPRSGHGQSSDHCLGMTGLTSADTAEPAVNDAGPEHDSCMDAHCPQTSSALQAQSSKLSKQKLETVDLSPAIFERLPPTRAGPCPVPQPVASFDYPIPPLYYSLCVLRL